jgi:hypothetical protein
MVLLGLFVSVTSFVYCSEDGKDRLGCFMTRAAEEFVFPRLPKDFLVADLRGLFIVWLVACKIP